MKKKNLIRLFINTPLISGSDAVLDEAQSHYLCHVMKADAGDEILAFDNQNGEFLCRIREMKKKSTGIEVLKQTREFSRPADIWLLFAPVKKDQTDFIIQKATELGALKLIPVITRRTIADKTKTERFKAQAVEAAEQCRRVDIPEISDAVSLASLLKNWNNERRLYFMDETLQGENIYKVFSAAKADGLSQAAILTGPEGGFDDNELELLRSCRFAEGVSMGKRILRAETAAAAALACWQAIAGDWQD